MALQEELEHQGNWLFKHRSYLPLLFLPVGMVIYLQSELYPASILEKAPYEFYYDIFALIIGLTGLYIRIITVGHAHQNTSGRNTKQGQVADTVNTTGMYSIVRHPLYIGNFLMWSAVAMLTVNFWFIIAFILLYWIYYERIMFAEEQYLRKKFGDEYLSWSKNVPAFIPAFKLYQKSNLPFNWKKVVKSEKNGLFALFLIFYVFNITGEWIKGKTDYNYFFIVMCVITGLLYIVIKYLKKNTSMLNEFNA